MKRNNSFDFLRLIAAVLVVYSHSFALTGHPEPAIGGVTLGQLGLWIFFIISGYFISASWDQYPRFNVFFAKRILRIFPGLIVAILITIFVCGIFYSSLPFIQYITNPSTLSYLNNILLMNPVYALPGVFLKNIYPSAVNGSIWTLYYEFTMYGAVALLGIFGIYKKISALKIWSVLFALELIMIIFGTQYFNFSIFYLNFSLLITLGLLFFTGVVFYKEEKRIKQNRYWGVISFMVFIVLSTISPNLTNIYASILLGYAIFSLGRENYMSWISKYGDFSYGIYIYSFPIQQMIVASTKSQSAPRVFLLSIVLSIVIAAMSWHLVESKALILKNRIDNKRYPLEKADKIW